MERPPLCVLLLPAPLERFILRDQAEDLLRADGVVAADPPRMPYGAFARMPLGLGDALAARQARRLLRTLRRRLGEPRVVVIFHPLQYQLAARDHGPGPRLRALVLALGPLRARLRRDRRQRERLELLHEQAAERSLDDRRRVRRARARWRAPPAGGAHHRAARRRLVPRAAAAATSSPSRSATSAGAPTGRCCARSSERLGDRLVLLLVGAWHEEECKDDADFAFCRAAAEPRVARGASRTRPPRAWSSAPTWGSSRSRSSRSTTPRLPYRILKYARLGRRTVTPDLAGVRTWSQAVTVARRRRGLRAGAAGRAGARARPDEALREWALAQTARAQNEPLWQRLAQIGIDTRVSR